MRPARGRTFGFYFALFVGLFVLQLLLYRDSFRVKPANDDFGAPLTEVRRGEEEGPLSFFRQSAQAINYRPLQSLTMWGFGRISEVHRYEWIRCMHFVGMAGLEVVLFLWLAALPIGRSSTAAAAAVFFFHPTHPAPLASIDGLSTLYSSAALWLGAWCVLVNRRHPRRAAMLALACFIVGIGYKEFLLGLVPLAGLTALCFGGPRRWGLALAVCSTLCLAVAVLLVVRHYTIPPGGGQGLDYIAIRPLHLLENAAVFGTGLLFFGNSIWVFLHRGPGVLAMVGGLAIGAAAAIAWGIYAWAVRTPARLAPGRRLAEFGPRQWVPFLVLSLAAASFPANVIHHVSEMYLAPVVFALALSVGLAVEGAMSLGSAPRVCTLAVLAAVLAISAMTVRAKVAGMVDAGDRADRVVRRISQLLPPGVRGARVVLLFRTADLPPDRTFSVYRMGDDALLGGQPTALDVVRPGARLGYEQHEVDRFAEFQRRAGDLVFGWDAARRDVVVVAPPANGDRP